MSVPRRVVASSNAEPQSTAAPRKMLTTFLIHAEKKGRISRAALKGFAAITNAPMPIVERKASKILRRLRCRSLPPAAPHIAPWIENVAQVAQGNGLKKSTQEIADKLAFVGATLVEGYAALPEEEKFEKLRVAWNRKLASERVESQAAGVKIKVKKENTKTTCAASKRGRK
eukprot:GHVT01041104.1.p1 GENE.GHVT01041104.1~~GHVT01041104.1.p1  ORF type:complete len:172 (+),score=42.70 GHVT01041104.1:128-643(+)